MVLVLLYFGIMLSPIFPPVLLGGVDVVERRRQRQRERRVARARKKSGQAALTTAAG